MIMLVICVCIFDSSPKSELSVTNVAEHPGIMVSGSSVDDRIDFSASAVSCLITEE